MCSKSVLGCCILKAAKPLECNILTAPQMHLKSVYTLWPSNEVLNIVEALDPLLAVLMRY